MSATREKLLGLLPPFDNRSILIEPAQDIPDIVREVVNAHRHFAADYDNIFEFFDSGSLLQTCRDLFQFCRRNITYVVEGEDQQTTKSPAAILAMGYGDCKHYAGFIGGVLAAIKRNTGRKIDWNYRFGSYDYFSKDPGHVFIVVNDNGQEIWIDPVLSYFNSREKEPSYIIDKKINAMPLYRISGMPQVPDEFTMELYNAIGVVDPATITMIATTVMSFVKVYGADQVANYPVKKKETFDGLVAMVGQEIPLPPTSVEHAQQLLQKTMNSRAAHVATGGTGAANQTVIMLYDEIITALQGYIAEGGGVFNPNAPGTLPGQQPDPRYQTQYSNQFGNPVIWAAGAGILTWFFTKKPLYAVGAAAAGYFVRDHLNKQ